MTTPTVAEWPELTPEGRGSFFEIAAYITTVIEQRTTVADDTTAERLGRGIAYSVLSRLRDTSGLTVRADELTAAHDAGYRKAAVGSLRDAVGHGKTRNGVAAHMARLHSAVTEFQPALNTRPWPPRGRTEVGTWP